MKIVFCICLFLCFLVRVRAQLCTGIVGDPTVHITFGTGTNPGAALPPNVTSYAYAAKDCPDDGQYTLVNNSLNCFNQTWHVTPADHTPSDFQGYFMLVNASAGTGDFYVNTVSGLCTNTTYEFAAWIMNILKPGECSGNGIDPNLTFSIETTAGLF